MYGNEGQNSLNFTVSAPNVSDNSPSGSVNLYDGVPGPDTYLCTGFLGGSGPGQSGGNCYINNAQMSAGLYTLTATYSGDNNFAGSSSLPQDFSVVQVTSQMQLFPVPGYAFYGAETGNFFITGVGGGNGGNPTGFFSDHGERGKPRSPRLLFSRKRWGEPLLHRLGHSTPRLRDAL